VDECDGPSFYAGKTRRDSRERELTTSCCCHETTKPTTAATAAAGLRRKHKSRKAEGISGIAL